MRNSRGWNFLAAVSDTNRTIEANEEQSIRDTRLGSEQQQQNRFRIYLACLVDQPN
jgi:hypothetical protein